MTLTYADSLTVRWVSYLLFNRHRLVDYDCVNIANFSLKEQSKEVIQDLQAAVRLAQDEAKGKTTKQPKLVEIVGPLHRLSAARRTVPLQRPPVRRYRGWLVAGAKMLAILSF